MRLGWLEEYEQILEERDEMTLDELITQYKGNAKAMRSGQAHPNLSGIWDNVVTDLERLRDPEPPDATGHGSDGEGQ